MAARWTIALPKSPLKPQFISQAFRFEYKVEAVRRIGLEGEDMTKVVAEICKKYNLKEDVSPARRFENWRRVITDKINQRDETRRKFYVKLCEKGGLSVKQKE